MKVKPRFVVDCADHAGFIRLEKGTKTVLMRAKKSLHNKDYTASEIGDILELVDVRTSRKIHAQVETVSYFRDISELFNTSNIANESFDKKFASESELRAEFEGNRPGYTKLLDQNGIVVWRIKFLTS